MFAVLMIAIITCFCSFLQIIIHDFRIFASMPTFGLYDNYCTYYTIHYITSGNLPSNDPAMASNGGRRVPFADISNTVDQGTLSILYCFQTLQSFPYFLLSIKMICELNPYNLILIC